MIDPNLTGIIIVGIVALIPITIVSVVTLSRTRLKVEQIKANAMIKAEEVKAKNQLEIERLLCGKSTDTGNRQFESGGNFESSDNRQVREKIDTSI